MVLDYRFPGRSQTKRQACKSEWGDYAAGVPQGIEHVNWLFNLKPLTQHASVWA